MGATVEPIGPAEFSFYCQQCEVEGARHATADEAQAEGLRHEHEWHPRVYIVRQYGSDG